MPSVKIYNMKGEETGAMELGTLFDIEYKEDLIHQAVVTRLANERQGTKSTLTRSEVRGGGKKPWRQKGTGNARQGSTRAPQWIKGGVVFAPKSRDFSKKLNVTMKRIALLSALSQKVRDGEIIVVDKITCSGKTREMVKMQEALGLDKHALVLLAENDVNVRRAAANIPAFDTMNVALLNCYDAVRNDKLVFAKDAMDKFIESMGEHFIIDDNDDTAAEVAE